MHGCVCVFVRVRVCVCVQTRGQSWGVIPQALPPLPVSLLCAASPLEHLKGFLSIDDHIVSFTYQPEF